MTMTNLEFQAEQSKLGLTNEKTAKLCRVSIRTVEKWRQGTRSVPGPVIALLFLCRFYKGAVSALLNRDT